MITRRALLFIFLVTPFMQVAAEETKIRVAILPLDNLTASEEYDAICKRIPEIITLVTLFQKDRDLVEWRGLPPSQNQEALSLFAQKHQLQKLYYGNLTGTESEALVFTIYEWDSSEKAITQEFTETVDAVVNIFKAADRIILEVAEQLGHPNLTLGSLALRRDEGIGKIALYLDGNLFSQPNRVFNRMPSGSYNLSLRQQRLTGEKVILERSITIEANQILDISYAIPPADPEERVEFARLREELRSAGENSQEMETLIASFTSFQEKTQGIDYDAELMEVRDQQIKESEALFSKALRDRVETLDSQFYQENADFGQLAGEYGYLSSVITPQYWIDSIEDVQGEALSIPDKLLVTDNGYLYVSLRLDGIAFEWMKERLSLGGAEGSPSTSAIPGAILLAFNPDREFIGTTLFSSDFLWASDRDSRLYTYSPEDEKLQVWEGGLVPVQDIPIPGLSRSTPLRMGLTISDEDIAYLFLDDDVHVFSSQYDPLLEDYPFRYTDLEEGLSKTLTTLSWKPSRWQAEGTDTIHISDGGNSRILVIDPLGEVKREISLGNAVEDGTLWIDSVGHYYICDSSEHQIRKYTPLGALVATIGGYGIQEGAFSRPLGGTVDREGILYVADSYNSRIQIFHPRKTSPISSGIAEFHSPLWHRVERSEEGKRNIDFLDKLVRENTIFSMALGGGLLSVGLVGALVGYDVSSYLAVANYNNYLAAIDAGAVASARESVEGYRTLGRASLLAAVPLVTAGTYFFVDGLLNTAKKLYVRPLAYKNVQTQDLDLLYSLDKKDYRNPQTALALGLGTSLIPGVLSAGLTIAELILLLNDENVGDFLNPLHYANMALIAIPPLGAHLYGGQISISLSIASLVADLLAVGALLYYKDVPFQLQDQQTTTYSGETFAVDRAITSLSPYGGALMLLMASSVRLAAGIFDARFGWFRALDYNAFEGRTGTAPGKESAEDSDVELALAPHLTPQGGLGFSVRVSW